MDNLFIDFLNTSITASYIIIAVLLIRCIFKKIPKKFICVLWSIAGLRLVLPFSIESVFSLIPSTKIIDPVSGNTYGLKLNSGISTIDIPVNNYFVENKMSVTETVTPADKEVVISVIGVVWLIGISVILLYGFFSCLKLKKFVSTAVLLNDNVMQSECVISPFILGFFKPKVYVPFGMSEEALNYVVAHEKAHIKRRDHWIKPIGFLILAFYWFNPLLWVAYIMLCRDIERACDEKVISQMDENERKEYAQVLLDCAVNRYRIAACPLAFGEVGIKERIKGIINYKKPAFWAIIIAIIACVIVAVCFLTNPKNEASDDYEYPYRIVAEINYDDSGKEYTRVFSAQKGDQHTVVDGVVFTVSDVDLQTGEIDLGFDGENRPISAFSGKQLGLLVVNLTQSHRVKTASGAEITFSFVQTQTVDYAISKAIMEYNKDLYMEGSVAFESHETLKIERDKGFVGSDDAENVTVYLNMAYGEYVLNNDEVECVGGCSMPIALHFNYIDGIYTLTEYWQPKDGSRYVDSIRKKFPLVAAEIAIQNGGEGTLSNQNREKAKVYFEGLDNGCAVNTGVDGFNANVLAMPVYGDNPYIEIEWSNGTLYDIACTGTHGMQMYVDYSWVNVQTGTVFEPTYLKIIEPGEAYTVKYSLDMFDIENDGLYRFTDVFTINGEKVTAWIDFNKGPVKGDADVEEPSTIAVFDEEPLFDTSEYNSVISVSSGKFVARKIIDKSAYSALLDENGNEIIPLFRGEIRRINGNSDATPILSVEPFEDKHILTDADGKKISNYEFNGTGINENCNLIYGYTDEEYVFLNFNGEHLATVKDGEIADLLPEQWKGYIITVKNCGNSYKFGVSKNGVKIIPCEYDEIEVVSADRIVARIGESQSLAPTDILHIFDGSGNRLTTDGDYNYAAFIGDEEYGVASKLDDNYNMTCWLIDKDGNKHSEGYDTIYGTESGYVGEKDGLKYKIKL